MNEGVLLLFLRRIFPEWSFVVDEDGIWQVSGHVHVSVPSVDGVLDVLAVVEPEAGERVRRLFR